MGFIFVWVLGNGGWYEDSCNCDGYIDSIYILLISLVFDYGELFWYLESCFFILVIIFSSGVYGEKRIVSNKKIYFYFLFVFF